MKRRRREEAEATKRLPQNSPRIERGRVGKKKKLKGMYRICGGKIEGKKQDIQGKVKRADVTRYVISAQIMAFLIT